MSRGAINRNAGSIAQPNAQNTRKGQKRFRQGGEYDGTQINSELDYIHERINQIVVEDPAIEDLDSGATLTEVIERLNSITETLRSAGLLRPS